VIELDKDKRASMLDVQLMRNAALDGHRAARNQRERASSHALQRNAGAVGVDNDAPPVAHVAVIEHDTNCAIGIVQLQFGLNCAIGACDAYTVVEEQHCAARIAALVAVVSNVAVLAHFV